jgi:hypothetical protein
MVSRAVIVSVEDGRENSQLWQIGHTVNAGGCFCI